jgi:hypothetical protein
MALDCADLTDRESAAAWAAADGVYMISLTDGWRIGMRSVLILCLLIGLCAAADAAPMHHARPKGHLRHGQHVTVPSGFAVPGWTDEETRQWLYNGSAAAGLG